MRFVDSIVNDIRLPMGDQLSESRARIRALGITMGGVIVDEVLGDSGVEA